MEYYLFKVCYVLLYLYQFVLQSNITVYTQSTLIFKAVKIKQKSD